MKLFVYKIESRRDAVLVYTAISCLCFFFLCGTAFVAPIIFGWNEPTALRSEVFRVGQRTLYLYPAYARVIRVLTIPAMSAGVVGALIVSFTKKGTTKNHKRD